MKYVLTKMHDYTITLQKYAKIPSFQSRGSISCCSNVLSFRLSAVTAYIDVNINALYPPYLIFKAYLYYCLQSCGQVQI